MQALFSELVKLSLVGSLFAVAVILLRFVFRKAPKWFFCLLWGMVALRLICPFSIESQFSLVPDRLASGQMIAVVGSEQIGQTTTLYLYEGNAPEADQQPLAVWDADKDSLGAPKTVGNTVFPILGWIWMAGMVLMFAYTAVSYLVLRKRMEEATRLRDNIWQCEQVDSPFVLGIIKPKIYLPYAITESDMTNVIAHEQAHIRRKDHWWKPIGFLLLSVYWFNPVLWLAYILLCRDIEAACDEKVIKHMRKDEMQAYSTALLNCSIHRRRIAACPLAFGEVGVKERVKSVMHYKKPALWIVVAAVVTGVAVAVCLLTDPMGSGYSRVEKITNQKGYSIVNQESERITLSLSTADLPDSIYTETGCEFEDGQIIAYDDGANQIYLKGVRYSNEGTDNLYFYFEFEYDLPRDGGQLLYPHFIMEDGITYATYVEAGKLTQAGTLRTETDQMENAVRFREQDSNGRQRIWFYVSTDAIKQIDGAFAFDIRINQITYLRDGAASEILTSYVGSGKSGSVKVAGTSSAADESEFTLEVFLPKTNLSQPGQILTDKIAEDWERFDQMDQLDQHASSHIPGTVYINTDTWAACENAVGVAVANPLEHMDWLEKTGYFGMESVEPSVPATHVKATAYATQSTARKLSRVDIQSGYSSGNVRITLTATICAEDCTFTTGSITRGYATFTQEETTTGSGIPVIVVTTDKENNLGYYNDGWCEQEAYWVEGNLFYNLRVVGDQENPDEMKSTLQKLLCEL